MHHFIWCLVLSVKNYLLLLLQYQELTKTGKGYDVNLYYCSIVCLSDMAGAKRVGWLRCLPALLLACLCVFFYIMIKSNNHIRY